jgi:Arc/MetJ-type ribon-helix-helix transcriptional regulator
VKKDGEDRSTYIRRALDDWLDRHESGWRDEPRQQDRAA